MSAPAPWLDVVTARDSVACREISASELLEGMLARTTRLNPALNAVVADLADAAREQARKADAALANGRSLGPLHGITIGVKDIIDVEGVPTSAGSRSLGHAPARRDATCVARLRAAGAIVVAKLHTHELAAGITSDNERFGRARNPWNPDHIPGGSSGGAAIATAAGLVHGALGTDTGGSIRIPAAFCGVVGLKGTLGRVSRAGVLARSWSMDHIGPITRRVRDAALLFEVIAGPDRADALSSPRAPPSILSMLDGNVRGLRAGIVGGAFFEAGLDADVAKAFAQSVECLGELGVEFRPVEFPLAEATHAAGYLIAFAEAAATQRTVLRDRRHDIGADVRRQLQAAEFISTPAYLRSFGVRTLAQRALREIFRTVDVLVLPTVPVLPLRCDAPPSNAAMLLCANNTRLFSTVGLPAISVPAGFSSSGLPVGLQIVGRPFDEATIARVADAYERATPWHTMWPPLAA